MRSSRGPQQRIRHKTRWFAILAALLVAAIATAAFRQRPAFSRIIAKLLVRNDRRERADLVVVLGGEFYGNRVLTGAELVRQGYAPAALISGPPYRSSAQSELVPESELAVLFLEKKGYPRNLFISYPNAAKSTIDEADILLKELSRRHIKRFLIVTSSYHSRRAGMAFRWLCLSCRFAVIAAPDSDSTTLQQTARVSSEFPKLLATPFACIWHRLTTTS